MKQISDRARNKLDWFNWLNEKWSNYEPFIEYDFGVNPSEVAEKFLDIHKSEFIEFLDSFDKEDIDAIDQFQKLTESESHVLKIICDQIHKRDKVRFVDFQKKNNKI